MYIDLTLYKRDNLGPSNEKTPQPLESADEKTPGKSENFLTLKLSDLKKLFRPKCLYHYNSPRSYLLPLYFGQIMILLEKKS